MPLTEKEYIELCKRAIEEKFSFGNGHGYSQKDLEALSAYIQEEKGRFVSLSTLKRVWKNRFTHGPQLATLNALANALDYSSWQEFKLQFRFKGENPIPNKSTGSKNKLWHVIVASLFVFAIASFLFFKKRDTILIMGPVTFYSNKTLTRGVPNTFIFKYDLSNVEADSFFIQQSWNNWRKERINPERKVFSSIYYESGFHRARLIANDSVIAMQPVHILSDGWEPHIYYNSSDQKFIDFKGAQFIQDGIFHLPSDLLKTKNVDTSQHFVTRVSHSKPYEVTSDSFTFRTRAKLEEITNCNCPFLTVLLITEKNAFHVSLVQKGCENEASYELGEIEKSGNENDLSKLGVNLFDWQDIEISSTHKKTTVKINNDTVVFEEFKEDFGKIMGVTFIFDGTGSIDNVSLSNELKGVVFEDDFDNTEVE